MPGDNLNSKENITYSKILANINQGNISWNTLEEFERELSIEENINTRINNARVLRTQRQNEWKIYADEIYKTIDEIVQELQDENDLELRKEAVGNIEMNGQTHGEEVNILRNGYEPGEIRKLDEAVNSIETIYKEKAETLDKKIKEAEKAVKEADNNLKSYKNLPEDNTDKREICERKNQEEKKLNELKEKKKTISNLEKELNGQKLTLNRIDSSIRKLSNAVIEYEDKKNIVDSAEKIINALREAKRDYVASGDARGQNRNTNSTQYDAEEILRKFLEWDKVTNNQRQSLSNPNQNLNLNPIGSQYQYFAPYTSIDKIQFGENQGEPYQVVPYHYKNVDFYLPPTMRIETGKDNVDIIKDDQDNIIGEITKNRKGEVESIHMPFNEAGCVIVNGKRFDIPEGSELNIKVTPQGLKCVVTNGDKTLLDATVDLDGEYVGDYIDNLSQRDARKEIGYTNNTQNDYQGVPALPQYYTPPNDVYVGGTLMNNYYNQPSAPDWSSVENVDTHMMPINMSERVRAQGRGNHSLRQG